MSERDDSITADFVSAYNKFSSKYGTASASVLVNELSVQHGEHQEQLMLKAFFEHTEEMLYYLLRARTAQFIKRLRYWVSEDNEGMYLPLIVAKNFVDHMVGSLATAQSSTDNTDNTDNYKKEP